MERTAASRNNNQRCFTILEVRRCSAAVSMTRSFLTASLRALTSAQLTIQQNYCSPEFGHSSTVMELQEARNNDTKAQSPVATREASPATSSEAWRGPETQRRLTSTLINLLHVDQDPGPLSHFLDWPQLEFH